VGATATFMISRRMTLLSKAGFFGCFLSGTIGLMGGSVMGIRKSMMELTTLPPNSKASQAFFMYKEFI
jgi:hypothetical protein